MKSSTYAGFDPYYSIIHLKINIHAKFARTPFFVASRPRFLRADAQMRFCASFCSDIPKPRNKRILCPKSPKKPYESSTYKYSLPAELYRQKCKYTPLYALILT